MHDPEARELTLKGGDAPLRQAGTRKSYHSPELKVHGTVQEKTLANSTGGGTDGAGYS